MLHRQLFMVQGFKWSHYNQNKNSGLSKSDEKVHKVEYSGQYAYDQVSKNLIS